ncbi:SDR family NAD(P)-dependent oxidoreductase [Rhizobium sp. PL01]|uniref:SDR family NAD(P)-dependent oxidoreductase n=1 Tax=Rhizobium sp. PL01 TaxID=3085631 RepID=UPI002980C887|nr:SDR family NAD(P)-dependent oxidoreductase [Rhizobium sp. PL01]MDW5318456.1 SDR family NAD(P)-dependent oxidoreductase [Rhizobium sp. PL01]
MSEQTRTVLVTGASRGIGKAIAVGMAKRGYDVAINDIERQKDVLSDVALEIEALGRKALVVFADVSSKADVSRMADEIAAAFGHLDAVVNNAGILISGDVEGLKEEYWDSVMDVNAKGTFLVIQSVLPMMKARKYGRIVNIASIGGKHGAPEQAHYSASKAAVMGFTRVLAQEVGGDGITANCVCPGIILTDMGRVNLDDPTVRKAWQDKTAMRRIGDPEDVVGAVAFLASDDAAFITGQTLNVDGGIVLS